MAAIYTVRVGDALQLGDHTIIRIEQKRGQAVKLSVESPIKPIAQLTGAHAPRRDAPLKPVVYTTGLDGVPRPVPVR